VIERLVASVLPVEARLMDDPERDPGDRRHDRGTRYSGRDL
jgi:hypothetical protein